MAAQYYVAVVDKREAILKTHVLKHLVELMPVSLKLTVFSGHDA